MKLRSQYLSNPNARGVLPRQSRHIRCWRWTRARSRSSVRPRFVDVKMRLIALRRQSLVRNERSRSWTLFSNSKKGIGRRSVTPPKRTIDVYYKVFRSLQERAPCPSVASGNVLTHLPRSTPVRALQERPCPVFCRSLWLNLPRVLLEENATYPSEPAITALAPAPWAW